MIFNPTIDCPCQKNSLTEIITFSAPPKCETRFNIRPEVYNRTYEQCLICGHCFSNHSIDLSNLYTSEYVNNTYGGIQGMKSRFDQIMALPEASSDNKKRISRINGYISRLNYGSLRLLDIGSGIGVFPYSMKENSWEVTCTETDIRTVDMLRYDLGLTVYQESIFELKSDDIGKFNLITLNKVLEHIENPASFLTKVIDFLYDDGIIYIEVPDQEASSDSYQRPEFCIEHHHVFSVSSTSLLAKVVDLKILELASYRDPSGKFTISAFLGK